MSLFLLGRIGNERNEDGILGEFKAFGHDCIIDNCLEISILFEMDHYIVCHIFW